MKVLVFFLLVSQFSFGQFGLGTIHGTLINDDGEFTPFIRVRAYSNDDKSVIKDETESDFDGRFMINGLPEGTYNLVLSSDEEFDTLSISNVQVESDRVTFLGEIKVSTNKSFLGARIPEIIPPVQRGFEDPFGRFTIIKEEDLRKH